MDPAMGEFAAIYFLGDFPNNIPEMGRINLFNRIKSVCTVWCTFHGISPCIFVRLSIRSRQSGFVYCSRLFNALLFPATRYFVWAAFSSYEHVWSNKNGDWGGRLAAWWENIGDSRISNTIVKTNIRVSNIIAKTNNWVRKSSMCGRWGGEKLINSGSADHVPHAVWPPFHSKGPRNFLKLF